MRRPLRLAAFTVAAMLAAGALFLVPTIWGKPWSIDHYFLRVLVEFATPHPMVLSYARVLEPYGLDFHSGSLEDFSVAAEERMQAQWTDFRQGLAQYDGDDLTAAQRLSRDVLAWFLESQEAGAPFLFHSYPVEQFAGLQSQLPDFMVNVHQIKSLRDARHYVERLEGFGLALDQLGERVQVHAARGVLPPRFVLVAVGTEIDGLVAPAPESHVLYTHLEQALAEVPDQGPADRVEVLARGRAAIADVVYPGYRRLAANLASLLPEATDDAGVWKLPDGDAYYRWSLRRHTTSDLGPDEVHALGLAEVARIQGEMRAILAAEGLPADDLGEALRAVHADPRFLYPDTDEGRAQILADYQAILDETQARLPAYFGRLPRAPVVVKRVPEFKQAGAAGAYYEPPSFDGARPGVFYANLRSVREVAKFGLRTLAYHEAIPGHHLQIALSFELSGVPFFRRVIPFTAFSEGWALYAERLAAEEGFLPTPWDRLGQLVAEDFRAVRLVVDTGIHAKRWTREEAIAYMLANTGMPQTDVVAEVERYIVTPGQACAYKVGQLEILRLRDEARARLGPRFDLRAFHDVVLGQGSLPLGVLDQVVERWLAEQG